MSQYRAGGSNAVRQPPLTPRQSIAVALWFEADGVGCVAIQFAGYSCSALNAKTAGEWKQFRPLAQRWWKVHISGNGGAAKIIACQGSQPCQGWQPCLQGAIVEAADMDLLSAG